MRRSTVSASQVRSARRPMLALVALSAIGLAACSGSTPAASGSPSAPAVASQPAAVSQPAVASQPAEASQPPATPSATASQAATPAQPSSGPTAVPTSIDPCQLITAQEAGALVGTSFGPGKEETRSGNSRACIYGSGTKNVFEVTVAIAPDAATAKKAEDDAMARLKADASKLSQGIAVTELLGFAPDTDAVLLELKPNPYISGRAIYFLRGTSFAGFSDLTVGGAALSADVMKAEAMTVLGRLP